MVARKHVQVERITGLETPGREIRLAYLVVLRAAKSGDRTIERIIPRVVIRFADREIRAQKRQHQLHDLGVLQHRFGRTMETT